MGQTQSSLERAEHWDATYRARGVEGVSWFQPAPIVSLALIDDLAVPTDTAVIDVGGGASRLADELATRGFSDVTVLDVSAAALEAAQRRLGPDAPVTWLRQDLLAWRPERRYGLWHDRAVFHFLIDPTARQRYTALLQAAVEPGGWAIVATFAPDGPDHCSGLPVARYSTDDLAGVLGDGFTLVDSRREEHATPAGAIQPFTWIALRRSPS